MPDDNSITIFDLLDLVLCVAGGAVLIVWVRRCGRAGRADPLRGSPLRLNVLSPLWLWLSLLVYAFAGLAAGSIASLYRPAAQAEAVDLWRGILATNLMQAIVIFAVTWIASRTFVAGLGGFGLRRRSLRADLHDAFFGFLAAYCLCTLFAWLTEQIIRLCSPSAELPTHDVFTALQEVGTPEWIRFVAIIGAFVLAPIGEEMFFRGLVQTGIRRILPVRPGSLRHRWSAIALTALLFGLMHLATPQHVPALIVLGFILGYLYERTGSLVCPILMHMLFNGKSLAWYYLQGQM